LLEGCPIVTPRSGDVPTPCAQARVGTLIPHRLLIVSGPFATDLPGARVVAAIGRGVLAGGLPEPDLCPIEGMEAARGVAQLLDALDFDQRMRRARAVIIGDAHLEERALAGSVTFEIATRARQRGVPAYAVTGVNELNAFDARILDLQVILQASSVRALVAAGRTLATLV
jgi:glycerate kinase